MKFSHLIFSSFFAIQIAQGATIIREARTGADAPFATFNAVDELSNDYQNPTAFPLMLGVNVLEFTIGGDASLTGGATNGSDADIVAFQLPAGTFVSSILSVQPQRATHFFAAEFGDQFSFEPNGSTSSNFANSLDGILRFGGLFNELTRDFPNPDRNFVALFQETDGLRANVTLEITLVPEPTSSALCLLALLPLLKRRRN